MTKTEAFDLLERERLSVHKSTEYGRVTRELFVVIGSGAEGRAETLLEAVEMWKERE